MNKRITEFVTQQLMPGKIIHCMLPDDGTDIRLMKELKQRGVYRVTSVACRGFENLQTTVKRSGRLPVSTLYRLVSVFVEEAQADELFGVVYHSANIGEPGRGIIFQAALPAVTRYSLPDDVIDETVK